jgi:hypothetical protein
MQAIERQAADEDADRDRGGFTAGAGAFGPETENGDADGRKAASLSGKRRLPDATRTPSAVTVPSILNTAEAPATRARASTFAGPAAAGTNGPIAATRSRSPVGFAWRRRGNGDPTSLREQLDEDHRRHDRPSWKVSLKIKVIRMGLPPPDRALAMLKLDDFFEQPHRRLMRQAVDQRHRGVSIFRAHASFGRAPARAAARTPGHVSQILSRFAEIYRREPLLHVPAVSATWSAGEIWDAHRRYADGLASIGLGPGQLVLAAAGNSPATVALRLACRAAGVPIMPVDAGATPPEILRFADRFAAAAMIVPAALDVAPQAARAPAVTLDSGLRLIRLEHHAPRVYRGTAIPGLVDLVNWWGRTFDPLLMARPPFWKATIWIDVVR